MACTANVLLEVEDIVPHRFYYFIQARPGFEANGVEVELHVDVHMHQRLELRPRKPRNSLSIRENLYPRNIPAIRVSNMHVLEN